MLANKYTGKELSVTKLQNFEKTAVFFDRAVEKVRNGTNSMIAIFMGVFGQECYFLFNSAAVQHFKG